MNILSIKDLRKIYHTKNSEILAVDNFSFDLNEGDFVSIVGPSGCGKSTILSILCGLENYSTGSIFVKPDLKIGYMLQGDNLFDWLTIYDNCLLGLKVKGNVSKTDKDYVLYLLKTYGLEDFIDAYPSSLSGGMRQRVSLIRTLAVKPDLLLLDEPYSALDYQSRIAVSDDVFNIIKREKKSAIMVTHDIPEAVATSSKVIVLSKRPSIVKNIYDIDLNGSSPTENRKDTKFNDYCDLIWEDIDYHV